jgi:hypothetical protein
MDRPPVRLVIAAVLGIAAVAGCNDDGARTAPSPTTTAASTSTAAAADGDTGSWLFVVDASSGDAADGSMTLHDVDQHVVSFSDRPQRVVRRIPVANLVSGWDRLGFADDPPNASLTFEQDGVERVHTMTLSSPAITGDDVTFAVTPLEGAAPLALGTQTDEAPADFGPAALFIDASGAIGDDGDSTMTMTAISQDEYTKAAAAARQLSGSACISGPGPATACSSIKVSAAAVTWNVVVETPFDDGAVSSSMSVVPADGWEMDADVPQTGIGSRWINLTWSWPAISTSATSIEMFFQVSGDGTGMYGMCTLTVSSGSYGCVATG